jgi:hypothetical protein
MDRKTELLLSLPADGRSRRVIVERQFRTIRLIWQKNEILAGRNLSFPPLRPYVHITEEKAKCPDFSQDPKFVCGSLFENLTREDIVVVHDSNYTKVTKEHPDLFVVTLIQFQNMVDKLHNRPIQERELNEIGAQAADGEAHEGPRRSGKRKTPTSNIYGRKFLESEAKQSATVFMMTTILNNYEVERKRIEKLEYSEATCTELKLYSLVISHALKYKDDGVERYLEWASEEEQKAVRKYVETKCQHIDSTMQWQ